MAPTGPSTLKTIKWISTIQNILFTRDLLRNRSYMNSLDLKNAYYYVPIHSFFYDSFVHLIKSLSFSVPGSTFQSFISPQNFYENHGRSHVNAFRLYCTWTIFWLQDTLCQVSRDLKIVVESSSSLAWLVNFQKSDFSPSQLKILLRILLNSRLTTSFLPVKNRGTSWSRFFHKSQPDQVSKDKWAGPALTSFNYTGSQVGLRPLQNLLLFSWMVNRIPKT